MSNFKSQPTIYITKYYSNLLNNLFEIFILIKD